MSENTENFRGFFEAMRASRWGNASRFVVNDGATRGGFRGTVTSGTQSFLAFQGCIDEMKRLLDAFTIGKLSTMRISERDNVVTATYEVRVTFKGQSFSYRGESVTFSTQQVLLKVRSRVTFNSDGKIVGMENRLTNQDTILARLLNS